MNSEFTAYYPYKMATVTRPSSFPYFSLPISGE